MSLYGGWKTATITIATDDDLSAAVDLGQSFEFLNVILPTLTSSQVGVHVCATADGTFVPLGVPAQLTSTTTGGLASTFELGGYQHIKISTSAAQAANRSISVRGYRR